MRNFIQHLFNPVHVYCRLMDIGFSSQVAMFILKPYDKAYTKVMAWV